MKKWIIFTLVAISAVLRVVITPRLTHIPTPELSYEAFVHLFVGGLIGISWYNWDNKQATLYGRLGWALAFWELGWFIVQKHAS